MTQLIVQHNNVTAFLADALTQTGNTYNFTDNAPPPPPPPEGRQLTGLVTWYTHAPFTRNTDLTQYKNVAGVHTVDETNPQDWPYGGGTTWGFTIAPNRYVALGIDVPNVAPVTSHMILSPVYSNSADFMASISRLPGDFNPATALVVKPRVIDDGNAAFWFRNGGGTRFYIGLTPGGRFYINLKPLTTNVPQTIRITSV